MAVRILSQTCDGASKYNLKRTLAEALLTEGRNQIEQERLRDLAFVHYNLQLQNFKPNVLNDFSDEEIDPMDDWIVEKQQGTSIGNDEPMLIDLDSEDSASEGVV
nr:S-cell enriched with leucine-rich repeat-containing protein [Ipomoea batatas]